MDERLSLHQQQQIRDLTKQRDEARHDAEEWRQRAEAIHQEYQELRDQLRRGEFVKAKKVRVLK